MQEPPPPHVTPPKQKAATASNKERKNGKKKEEPADYSDGYGLLQIKSLNSVIEEMTYHAATCGNAIEHVNTDFKMGAGITTMWKCACNKTFRLFDKIAEMGCSNDCEASFGELSKFSEGKRLNLEHTDLWRSMIMLVVCRSRNIEKTHKELSELLGLEVTKIEEMRMTKKAKKRERNKNYSRSEAGKDARHTAKVTNAIRMGNEDNKKKHKSEKLSRTKSTKSKIKHCTKCNQNGHTARECPVLKRKSRKKQLMDWNVFVPPPKRAKAYIAKTKWC
ncbi:hypothetical protein QTG54_015826 [Skeletonema marinoi]|uniref:CCHC-type domain-containing protein n=1 Tax=Skeletonema marinoi TaxID=267567 RepID=A0AAD8XTU9_9STRA|nr:hypothetical protein QTG54_015826 [Skeletonema marinoi]